MTTTNPKFRRYVHHEGVPPNVTAAVKRLIADGMPARPAAELVMKAWQEEQEVTAFTDHVLTLRKAARNSTKMPQADPLGLHDDLLFPDE